MVKGSLCWLIDIDHTRVIRSLKYMARQINAFTRGAGKRQLRPRSAAWLEDSRCARRYNVIPERGYGTRHTELPHHDPFPIVSLRSGRGRARSVGVTVARSPIGRPPDPPNFAKLRASTRSTARTRAFTTALWAMRLFFDWSRSVRRIILENLSPRTLRTIFFR